MDYFRYICNNKLKSICIKEGNHEKNFICGFDDTYCNYFGLFSLTRIYIGCYCKNAGGMDACIDSDAIPNTTPKIVNVIKVFTPTPNMNDPACVPIKNMDYSNTNNLRVLLQAYVSSLSDVKSVSYTVGERLYNNTVSQIIFVNYVLKDDGQVYSKRYIVYMKEFGWKKGIFSFDGQCWIDPPHN
jgi:hypothetical protein